MAEVYIRNQPVDIDVRTELEQFAWTRPNWSSDKLIAASPFRYDRTPSFFVRLEQHGDYPAGTFHDSGAYDTEWSSGGLVKLLSFLRNETAEETEDYLLAEYAPFAADENAPIQLRKIHVKPQRIRQALGSDYLAQYTEDYSYLESRGIGANFQSELGIKYDAKSHAVVIPWRQADGRLANVKYRQTRGKVFWYAKGAWPIRELLFGIDRVGKTALICEAEIDALSWRVAGYDALATGGASFNEFKRDLILTSPIEELLIATDNDKAGEKLRAEIEQALKGRVRIGHVRVDQRVKDTNEALMKFGVASLRDAVARAEGRSSLYVNLSTLRLG